jgi:hypothetical protein
LGPGHEELGVTRLAPEEQEERVRRLQAESDELRAIRDELRDKEARIQQLQAEADELRVIRDELRDNEVRVRQLEATNERLMELSSEQRSQLDDLMDVLPPAFVSSVLHGQSGQAWSWLPQYLDGSEDFMDTAQCQNKDLNIEDVPVETGGGQGDDEAAPESKDTAKTRLSEARPGSAQADEVSQRRGAEALGAVRSEGEGGGQHVWGLSSARARQMPLHNSQRATDSQRRRLRTLALRHSSGQKCPAGEGRVPSDTHAAVAMRARNWNIRDKDALSVFSVSVT